ncbi:MAG: translation initiation factor IF-2 subunit gamma [Candidatus ainarchaeum sp.]|nr:translation initiation factor IF-2 subunit gamma [Candidatus ainarchaeum sp.]
MPAAEKTAKKETTGNAARAEQAVVNIGMVGHVDHGKTSLTQALTGKWTETHSEELKRGISIRLGYADTTFYKCPNCRSSEAYTAKPVCKSCNSKTEKLRTVSFVDAPGHETLLTTMLSGAALMQGALLVIAANEKCPQPQTTEHLVALKIAGIKNIVVAQNKIDLVDKKQALENEKQIKEFLKSQGFENAPIVPVAAHLGINIDLLIEMIEKIIPTPKFETEKPLKAYCIRSFDINKPGSEIKELKGGVLGGSIIQGTIKIGDKIEITPGIDGKLMQTTVKSLSCAAGKLTDAKPGGLIGIGTMLDPSLTQNDRMRGQVIARPDLMPLPAKKLFLKMTFIERVAANIDKKIRTNDVLVLTIGAMTALGTMIKEKGGVLEIDLKTPAVIEEGGKIAVSRKEGGRWRLIGYATPEK